MAPRKPRSTRMRRVDTALQEVLAEAVARLSDPRLGFVTITHVEATQDVREASGSGSSNESSSTGTSTTTGGTTAW